ncbi:MAG: calcium/sodium antiporter [Chloroflexota bacterium]
MQIPIWANWLLLLTGLAIITLGGDRFTGAAVSFARRARVSEVIIGAILVSLLTTLPEFTVTIASGILDHPQTAMGNAVGSVIFNIGFILGLSLLMKPLQSTKLLLRLGIVMCLSSVVIVLLSLDGYLGRWDMLGLTLGFLVFLYYFWKQASLERRRPVPIEEASELKSSSLIKEVIWFLLGGLGVVVGSTLIVQNAVVVARWLGVPELVIALTIVAIGTSLPELTVGITATIKGHGGIAAGDLIGASILDILWVMGAGGLVFPFLPVEHQTLVLDYPAMLIIVTLLAVFLAAQKKLSRLSGVILLTVYIGYLAALFLFFG